MQEATLRADVDRYAYFGGDVAIDGNVAAVASYLEGRGKVRLYERGAGGWSLVQTLDAPESPKSNNFGADLAIDGDTLLVGAPGSEPGLAHVYVRTSGTWEHAAVLQAPDSPSSDSFGTAVDLDGATAIVGERQGRAAYVFVDAGGSWVQQAKLEAKNGLGSNFGNDVAVEGDLAVVGAGSSQVFPVVHGSAHVFRRKGDAWSHQQRLVPENKVEESDGFGLDLEIDDGTILVAAPYRPAGEAAEGAVHVFEPLSSRDWDEVALLRVQQGGPEAGFGGTIAAENGSVVVGARGSTFDPTRNNEGAAYVFSERSGQWAQDAQLVPRKRLAEDLFGTSVAIDGATVVVGAPSELETGPHRGRAVVFTDPSWGAAT